MSLFGAKNQTKSKPTTSKPFAEPVRDGGRPKPKPPVEKPPVKEEKPEPPKGPAHPITDSMMQQELYLGHFDQNVISRKQIEPVIKTQHKRISGVLKDKENKLRNGDNFSWSALKPLDGDAVKTLQSFLKDIKIFPPFASIDGYFGYATQAGVRLFQEYLRTHGNQSDLIPNGVVDASLWKTMKSWQDENKKIKHWTRGVPSGEFNNWLQMLKKAKKHYTDNPHMIIDSINEKVDKLNAGGGDDIDTFKIEDWKFDPNEVHLIGIRRNEDDPGKTRINDDLFILLINGMVFKFWGSTDPRQFLSTRKDEAFLVEGQHKFRFGWHKISNEHKLYQGLNPYKRGVLVFRDDISTDDDRLTESDIKKGIDNKPNQTINIHWTGIGSDARKTWSAGCQVLASKSYIDNDGKEWDCSKFLASNYKEGGNQPDNNITKTKGAYNVFTDLIVCFRPQNVDRLYYTLGRDETLKVDDLLIHKGDQIVSDSIKIFGIPGTT